MFGFFRKSDQTELEKEIFQDVQEDMQDEGADQKNLKKMVKDLEQKVDRLNKELTKVKQDESKQPLDADLNDSIFQNAKKKAFLNVMDNLDFLADRFASTDPSITRQLDHISDQLRYYYKD